MARLETARELKSTVFGKELQILSATFSLSVRACGVSWKKSRSTNQ